MIGKLDRTDFLIPPFALFYFYLVFAAAFGLGFNRIQFTPDLLPGDITGGYVFDMRGKRVHQLDVSLDPAVTIRGTVLGPDHRPAKGVEVFHPPDPGYGGVALDTLYHYDDAGELTATVGSTIAASCGSSGSVANTKLPTGSTRSRSGGNAPSTYAFTAASTSRARTSPRVVRTV